MWARKRIDIPASQILKGLANCAYPRAAEQSIEEIQSIWSNSIPVYSVRSGFDLLLRSLQLPVGSEILMSGLTIPDMPRIARENQLEVVGVDLDLDTLLPCMVDFESKLSSRTRLALVAHLFGGRSDLNLIRRLTESRNVLLVEDCAQAYCGNHFQGTDAANVSLFSFGPIKTNTSLGGGLVKVRDLDLRDRMSRQQSLLPRQSNRHYARRLMKYLALRSVETRFGFNAFSEACKLVGKEHDQIVSRMARGLRSGDLMERIRLRPSDALLQMMSERIEFFRADKLRNRRRRAQLVTSGVLPPNQVVAANVEESTHWVLPIRCKQPMKTACWMWEAGFDATTHSSMRPVASGLANVNRLMSEILYLPFDDCIPGSELCRMMDHLGRIDGAARRFTTADSVGFHSAI